MMSELRPQEGPQEKFLSTEADIAIFGGAAGGGKSYALLLEPLRHVTTNTRFAAVFFRRNTTHIRNPGGLWDGSNKVYPQTGAVPLQQPLEWKWFGGGKIKMAHLENESTVNDWQGSEIPLILFDELTHFSAGQFWYMFSRNRSMSGVKGYIRASTNPDPDSWVAEFISWWINQDTGYAIEERSGKIRWFIRVNDHLFWTDTKDEMMQKHGVKDDKGELLPETHYDQIQPKSLTFILSKLTDNKALMQEDPSYMGNLKAMSLVMRERLLQGNWKIKAAAGLYFKRTDVTILETMPTDVVKWVRRWDLAATEACESNPDPDYTAGVLMGRRANGRYLIANVVRERKRSHEVRQIVQRVAILDPEGTKIVIPQDPGQAGKEQIESYISYLSGFSVYGVLEKGDKELRADPFAAQWQAGNVDILKGYWNDAFFSEMEQFPTKGVHDDQVDGSSGAFKELVTSRSLYDDGIL